MNERYVLTVVVALLLLCVSVTQAKIFFHEEFNSLDGWVTSKHASSSYGKVELSAGSTPVDATKEQGLRLTENAKFYALSKKLPITIDNADKPLVISYSVKNEQQLECGGAYFKFFSQLDQKDFHGDSPYWLMLGPDTCGGNNRVHIILNHGGENHLWKGTTRPARDHLTHVYTLEIAPNNTYQLYVDGGYKSGGSLEEEWDMVAPKTIADPNEKKPDDWVDDMKLPDPTDTKPADWDTIPATIVDAEAEKPEDWDDEEDGEWEAPVVPNPAYKGEWQPRMIKNPDYKGPWKAKQVPNPAYKPDATLYRVPAPLQYVGIDVWQVQSGSIFDNIIIGDDLQEVLGLVQSTYGAMAEQEKEGVKAAEEKEKAAAAEAMKTAEEEEGAEEEEATTEEPAGDDEEDL